MYSRVVNEETLVFGNQGALFLNALTMWDHETESVWGQVWGKALFGPWEGQTLEVLPSRMVPWSTWRSEHPETLVMSTGTGGPGFFRERPRDEFVIGIVVGESARAYRWRDASARGAINDVLGEIPIVVVANARSRSISAYARNTGEQTLTFGLHGDLLVDEETGSRWEPARGLALGGPLEGTALKTVPWTPAFDWAWSGHYPKTSFYRP